jgi:hypothetical protein
LRAGVEYQLPLSATPGHRWVTPHLICQTERDLPARIRIYVDDLLHQELRVRSHLAELRLNALPAGQGQVTRLRIETGGGIRLFMNHLELPAAAVYFKRMVHRFEGTALTFNYQKETAEEELLSLTLFQAETHQTARLHVRILGDVARVEGPGIDWTLLERIYELQAAEDNAIAVFATQNQHVVEQQRCFLRLGSDLPPGVYTIAVTREDARAGYLLLSRTTPGLSEHRDLASEPEPVPVTIDDNRPRRMEHDTNPLPN